jgi:hypothetical protein
MSKQLISNTLNKILGKHSKVDIYSFNNEKHYPKPDYDKCNAGHPLVEVWNDKRNAYVWDCPTCINKMRRAYNK